MTQERILAVDDEEDLLELVRYNLAQEGYEVKTATSGLEAIRLAESFRPDLVLLDLMMPGIDGFQVCAQLRGAAETASIPILMLTAKGEEADVIRGLHAGADDYVVKPFSPMVLVARVSAVLRRRRREVPDAETSLRIGSLTIDPKRHEVQVDGALVRLTAAEFRAIHHLARHPGWVFTRQQIVESVHGEDYVVTERSIDVLLVGLRKKLGPHAATIETVRGVGYRFKG